MGAANPWLDRRVLAYAHQGGSREAPSSTLHAIRCALDAGADAIELDVHATADRRLVVCHDKTVDRTTEGHGAIAEMTLADLARLDNAYWFVPGAEEGSGASDADYPLRGRAPADHRFGIATLDEVLEGFPGVIVNLDIKQTAPAVEPYEALLAETLVAHGRRDDVIVASFLDAATDAFSRVAPAVPTSAGTQAVAVFWRAVQAGEDPPPMRHVALQVPASFGDVTVVDERFVAAAHRAGMAVHVWTIDDPVEMDRLVALGVDGIISDVPSVLVGVLGRTGAGWHGGD